jgi:hypothetical protein
MSKVCPLYFSISYKWESQTELGASNKTHIQNKLFKKYIQNKISEKSDQGNIVTFDGNKCYLISIFYIS